MGYDAWKESGPHDDLPSTEQTTCSEPGCREPWTWHLDGEPLCEKHLDERMLAPTEEMAVTTGEAAA